MSRLMLLVLAGAALVGCSGNDIGDAEKDPPKGAAVAPGAPVGASGGAQGGASNGPSAAPQQRPPADLR